RRRGLCRVRRKKPQNSFECSEINISIPAEQAVQLRPLLRGAAIFLSQAKTFVVEELEQRTHLAATPLSAYYPLNRGSQWVYNIVDDGKRRTDTETISMQTKRMHGQSV